jgi:UDP-N-acetylglucosamine--N-acetylmuramyl-(pentapeptide) pyrophosphoryl-undecaprenol N-acetylglucosamine transferase
VLLAAGGTGGHLLPALAVAGELAARGARVGLVTTPSQAERVAAAYPYPVYTLPMHGFERRLAAANLRAVGELAAALPRAWRVCGEFRPDVVVGGGGFVSGPVLAAAGARRTPALAIENDARLGVANRLARPFVRRYCLSFPIAGRRPPKYVLTGRPLAAAQVAAVRADGLRVFGLRPDLPVVLAFGGSQGAQSINRACLDAFARETLEFQLVHVCGPRNFYEVEAERRRRGAPVERYRLVAYTDQLPAAMAAADLIVARSGGSVAEIAALGRPAILVPYPHATGDHQRKNAEWMVAGGAAVLVDDAELDGPLLQRLVGELLADDERRAAMAAASAGLGRPDATARVVEEIERVLA